MGIIDDLKKTGSSLAEGAERAAKVAEAQLKLRSLQSDVAAAQKALGAVAFDLLERGDLAHADLDAPLAKMKDALDLVAAKEVEITALEAEGKCCEAPAPEGAASESSAEEPSAET